MPSSAEKVKKWVLGRKKTVHFEKTESVKRLNCPWCEESGKPCFKSGKSLKFRGHFEDDHEFKCTKCGITCEIGKVESHLNTCRGTRLLLIKYYVIKDWDETHKFSEELFPIHKTIVKTKIV